MDRAHLNLNLSQEQQSAIGDFAQSVPLQIIDSGDEEYSDTDSDNSEASPASNSPCYSNQSNHGPGRDQPQLTTSVSCSDPQSDIDESKSKEDAKDKEIAILKAYIIRLEAERQHWFDVRAARAGKAIMKDDTDAVKTKLKKWSELNLRKKRKAEDDTAVNLTISL